MLGGTWGCWEGGEVSLRVGIGLWLLGWEVQCWMHILSTFTNTCPNS